MESMGFETVIRCLEAGSPFGAVALMSWLLLNIIEKRDRALRDLYQNVVEMSQRQSEAICKMEAALVSLRDTLRDVLR